MWKVQKFDTEFGEGWITIAGFANKADAESLLKSRQEANPSGQYRIKELDE